MISKRALLILVFSICGSPWVRARQAPLAKGGDPAAAAATAAAAAATTAKASAWTCPAKGGFNTTACAKSYFKCAIAGATPTTVTCPTGMVFYPASGGCKRWGTGLNPCSPPVPRAAALVLSLDPGKMTEADRAAGIWRDFSGRGNHMTLTIRVRSSVDSGGISLLGEPGSYASRANLMAGSIPGSSWTGIIWVRTDSSRWYSGGALMRLNYNRNANRPANFDNGFIWEKYAFREYNHSGFDSVYPVALPSSEAHCWQMLGVTKTATALTFFFNGKRILQAANKEVLSWGMSDFTIGTSYLDGAPYLEASVGPALMWRAALTDMEMDTVYRRDVARFAAALCATHAAGDLCKPASGSERRCPPQFPYTCAVGSTQYCSQAKRCLGALSFGKPFACNYQVASTIAPPMQQNGGAGWGGWSAWRVCPPGTRVQRARLLVASDAGMTGDDTAANALQLKCNNGAALKAMNDGEWGTWTGWQACPGNSTLPLTAARLKTEKSQWQGAGDDTGTNNVGFKCGAGDGSTSFLMNLANRGAGDWGSFPAENGGWVDCPPGTAICGFRQQVQAAGCESLACDDTSLNGLEFLCCTNGTSQS